MGKRKNHNFNNPNNNSHVNKPNQNIPKEEPYNPTYVDRAEEVIKKLVRDHNDKIKLSASKLRNILSMTTELKREVQRNADEELDEILQGRAQYLRMRIAYEYGRDNDEGVQDFIEKAELIDEVKKIGKSKKRLLSFCDYVEALTAYHKYYTRDEN